MYVNDPRKAKEYFQDKITFTTGPMELSSMISNQERINIIDVRAPEDFEKGHIVTAKNLPSERWDLFTGLDRDKPNIIYCYSQQCHLAAKAALHFACADFPVVELEGGFNAWKEYGLEVETAVAHAGT